MKQLYDVQDVMKITGMSQSYAYKIIRVLNKELREKGYLVVPGKVNARYLNDRYGIEETNEDPGI